VPASNAMLRMHRFKHGALYWICREFFFFFSVINIAQDWWSDCEWSVE
jgi:hypothetical protein